MMEKIIVSDFSEGRWKYPKALKYSPIKLDPRSKILHYGQSVFEGVMAYPLKNGYWSLFRVGITTETIEAALPQGTRVIRAMPNTPALVQQAATAFCTGRHATAQDVNVAMELFSALGVVYQVTEQQMDIVTGLSGSGPAYVFSFIEALADAGVKNGLPRDIAHGLAVQTVLGAATLVKNSGEHPALLRERVSSPGGTTIAALHQLENGCFNGTIMDAVDAAVRRSKELAARS
jgi:pyrroline-5-carboxylate reductase